MEIFSKIPWLGVEIPWRQEFRIGANSFSFKKESVVGFRRALVPRKPGEETWASSVPLGPTDYDTYYITYDGSAMKTKCI